MSINIPRPITEATEAVEIFNNIKTMRLALADLEEQTSPSRIMVQRRGHSDKWYIFEGSFYGGRAVHNGVVEFLHKRIAEEEQRLLSKYGYSAD